MLDVGERYFLNGLGRRFFTNGVATHAIGDNVEVANRFPMRAIRSFLDEERVLIVAPLGADIGQAGMFNRLEEGHHAPPSRVEQLR